MTSSEMLARVRTMLNEASAGFWSDIEIYGALTDGQQELVKIALDKYIEITTKGLLIDVPFMLVPLIKKASISVSSGSGPLPSDYLYRLYGSTSTQAAIIWRNQGVQTPFDQLNTIIVGGGTELYGYIMGTTLITDSGLVGSISLTYISVPVAIGSSQDATIPTVYHNTIIEFAYHRLLTKGQEEATKNSIQEFQQFKVMSE